MIEVKNLQVVKDQRTVCRVERLTVGVGERVGVWGANGSGKTTLLRVLGGLERDFSGTARVDTEPANVVYVHQSPYMFRGTVLDNINYGLRGSRATSRAVREQLASRCLQRLGCDAFETLPAAKLSGGEKRRVALARALVLEPCVLLLDEPFSDLDELGARAVSETLRTLKDCTVLITSPQPVSDDLFTSSVRLLANGS